MVWCGVVLSGVVGWGGVHDMVWCGVVWCSIWRGVVGVVWCNVLRCVALCCVVLYGIACGEAYGVMLCGVG